MSVFSIIIIIIIPIKKYNVYYKSAYNMIISLLYSFLGVTIILKITLLSVALEFIDTIILAGKSDSQQAADDEWEWIDQTLAGYSKPGSGVGWIFVAGHYPGMNNVQCHGLYQHIII